ncbi:MAG: ABC transporter ATP-binding protein, partial [Longicatena sp.]
MLKRMFPFMKKYNRYLIISCICVITETIFELIIPLIMADIIDVGVANGDKEYILVKGAQMII